MKTVIIAAIRKEVERRYLNMTVRMNYRNRDTVILDPDGSHTVIKVSKINFYNEAEYGYPLYEIVLELRECESEEIIKLRITDLDDLN